MAEFVSLNISWFSVLETSWCLFSDCLVNLLFWLKRALDLNMYINICIQFTYESAFYELFVKSSLFQAP